MKAIQMTEQGGPEVLQLVELPDPQPGPGEVLIKVDAAAVNFSDLMRRRGDVYPVPTPVPFVPGAEAAGTVAAVGEGVDLPVGTPVFGTAGADASGATGVSARPVRASTGSGVARAPGAACRSAAVCFDFRPRVGTVPGAGGGTTASICGSAGIWVSTSLAIERSVCAAFVAAGRSAATVSTAP